MEVFMRIIAKGWPAKTQISVILKEGSNTGVGLTGDVQIFARRGDNPRTDQALGLNNQPLVVRVNNGRWTSPEWDYDYWAKKGLDRLVARFTDPQGRQHEFFWSAKKDDRPAVPTSISKVKSTSVVDDAEPSHMVYTLVWTILDQFGKPVAGTVTLIHSGVDVGVQSQRNRLGVCIHTITVEGYDKELLVGLVPPTGEPEMLKLHGPKKPPAPPSPAKLSDLVARHRKHPTEPAKRIYTVYWTVLASNGDPVGNIAVNRMYDGMLNAIMTDGSGCCWETVEVEGYGTEQVYEVFIPGVNTPDAHRSETLSGPPKPNVSPVVPVDKLEISAASYPSSNGLFAMTAITLANDVKVKGRFMVSATEFLQVYDESCNPVGSPGLCVSLETGTDGVKNFYLGFAATQATVTCCVTGGERKISLLSKAVLRRQR